MASKILRTEKEVLLAALQSVVSRIEAAADRRPQDVKNSCLGFPRLVAVSKTKPVHAVIDCYNSGQRHFGENYTKELVDKSNDSDILRLCPDIKWHFIGPTSEKRAIKSLAKCPNLFMVETIQNIKTVDVLNAIAARKRTVTAAKSEASKLNVMIQVNTSGEAQKSGVALDCSAVALTSHILHNCPNLKLRGFMTIGASGHDLQLGPNPDFKKLVATRDDVCWQLNLERSGMELSFGMSEDFEHAIELGSGNVRVGSVIFGARDAKW